MHIMEKEVRSASKVVGIAKAQQWDSVQEAVAEKGEEFILALVNSQHLTNICNQVRAAAVGKPSTMDLAATAVDELIREGEIERLAGDTAAIKNAIASRIAKLKAKLGVSKEAEESVEN